MALFSPYCECLAANIPYVYRTMIVPGIVWTSLASQWNQESGTSVDGRYNQSKGHFQSVPVLLRQDTFIAGSVNAGSRTGRAFSVVSGSSTNWTDDLLLTAYGCYGLNMGNGGAMASATVVQSASATTDIEDCCIIVSRGQALPEVTSSYTQHQRSTVYTYIELAYNSPDSLNIRIAMEYGQPFRLDVSYDGGTTWQLGVAAAKDLGSMERYFANHKEVRFHVHVGIDYQEINVEIDDGHWLHFTPDIKQINPQKQTPDPFTHLPHLLPASGNIRISHQNGRLGFWYLPFRYSPVTVNKSQITYQDFYPNAQQAQLLGNSLTSYDADQQTDTTINTDGQTFSWTASGSKPDAGENLGSSRPVILSDATLYAPAIYDTQIPGYSYTDLSLITPFPVVSYEEIELFDEVTRTATARAFLTLDNHFGEVTDVYAYGNLAINLSLDNGFSGLTQRLAGVTDQKAGVQLSRQDPYRQVRLVVNDKSQMLNVPLGDEVVFDNWCLFSAVKFLCCDKGNIAPEWMTYVPDYPPGPAGPDCPYPILPGGFGNQPRLKFGPDQTIWNILQMLVQDSGDLSDDLPPFLQQYFPYNVLPVPYYMGFDSDGYFHFEPVALWNNPVTMIYSDSDSTGQGMIEEIEVFNSVADMRTDLHFQGIDADTYDLLYFHLAMPPFVLASKGYREVWIERNARYASQEYLTYIAYVAAIQASLPQQIVRIKVPLQPTVHAGDNIIIQEVALLGGGGVYNVKEVHNVMRPKSGDRSMDGKYDSYAWLTCRNIVNTL